DDPQKDAAAAEAPTSRSAVLGRPDEDLETMENSPCHRTTTTVVSWQRRRFKQYWSRLSQTKRPGRPQVSTELRKLVRTMAAANVTWGAPRIHGELLKLGFEISERTVSRLMPKQRKDPSNMEDVSDQPRRSVGLHRFLYGSHVAVESVVRIRGA